MTCSRRDGLTQNLCSGLLHKYRGFTTASSWTNSQSRLIKHEGRTVTNFPRRFPLPWKQSYLALQTVKNPYIFHFLQIGEAMWERELERGLFDLIFDYHCHTVRLKSQSFSSRWV